LNGIDLTTISGMQSQSNWNTSALITVENILIPAGVDKLLRLEFVNGAKFDIDAITFSPSPIITDGTYTLKAKSGVYLLPNNNGSKLHSTYNNTQGDSAKWIFTHLGDDVYRIESSLHTGKRVEVPFGHCGQGELVGLTNHNGPEDHLKWKVIENGSYLMFSPLHCLNYSLDAWAGNQDTVHIYWKNPLNDNQLFELIEETSNRSIAIVKPLLNMNQINTRNNEINVLPNPVSETLNIRILNNKETPSEIKIFDTQGRLLYSEITENQLTLIDTQKLNTSGLLIIQVSNKNETQIFKVVKR